MSSKSVFLLCLLGALPVAGRAASLELDAPHWRTAGTADFSRAEGFAHGLLTLKDDKSSAELAGTDIGDGTIEFDMKAVGDGMPGIRFRKRDDNSAEEFYLRTQPDCQAENDCIQYAPVLQGNMLWNAYPDYQSKAPVRDGWNHYKLVLAGRHMEVFVNDSPMPTLTVGHLEGDALSGGLVLAGPAVFANVSVLTDEPDPRSLTSWHVSPPVPMAADTPPILAAAPKGDWALLPADHDGQVNLARRYGRPLDGALAAAWLKTTVTAEHDMVKKVSMGWLGEASVFVGGKLVFAGKNLYYPATERRFPDGRLSLDNASFDLPLRAGANDIVVVLGNKFRADGSRYGWGLKMRLEDLAGIGKQ